MDHALVVAIPIRMVAAWGFLSRSAVDDPIGNWIGGVRAAAQSVAVVRPETSWNIEGIDQICELSR